MQAEQAAGEDRSHYGQALVEGQLSGVVRAGFGTVGVVVEHGVSGAEWPARNDLRVWRRVGCLA